MFKLTTLYFLSTTLFLFFQMTGIAQNQLSKTINEVTLAKTYPQKIEKMILLSRLYRESDSKKAVEYALKTIDLAKKHKDTVSIAQIYAVFGTTVSVQGNYPLELKYINKAIDLIKNKSDDLSQARLMFLLFNKVDYETRFEKDYYTQKKQSALKCLYFYLKTKNYLGIADTYSSLALTAFHKADIIKPTITFGPSTKNPNQKQNKKNARLLFNEAISLHQKAYIYFEKAGMKDRMAACVAEIARVKIIQKDFKSAEVLLDSAMKMHHYENAIIGEGKCNMLYSMLKMNQNKLAEALQYAEKALLLYQKTNYNLEIASVCKNIASIFEKQYNYKKAITYHLKAFQYQENSYNENRSNSLFEIQNSYENQLKNSTIQKLKSEQKLAKLEKQQTLNYILGAAFVFFILIIAAVILYFFKEKTLKEARKNIELTQLLNASLTSKVNEAELTAMRAEMNPHFVFNIMNSIQGLIVSNRQSEAITYLNDFSRLSRRILDQSTSKYINFSEEIAFLKNYLALEGLRFDDKFSVNWQIDESIELDEVEIPPMLIQPFLENAIKHGLLPKQGKGLINIIFVNKENDSLLYCEITDNGVGRNQLSNSKKTHNSKGIAITEKRLELLNITESEEQNYTFNIIDLKDTNNKPLGTQVQLFIPYESL